MNKDSKEYVYAAPIAKGLVADAAFRRWVLLKTEFAEFADARVLDEEMK